MISSAVQGRGASHCHHHTPFPSLLGTDEGTRAALGAPLTSLHINPVLLRRRGTLSPLFSFPAVGYLPKGHICDAHLNSPKPTVPQSLPKANSTLWFIQASAGLISLLPLPAPGSATRDGLEPYPTRHFFPTLINFILPVTTHFLSNPLPHWRERCFHLSNRSKAPQVPM